MEAKELKEKEKKGFGVQFDFNNMFRVVGKSGLYYPISKVSKSGMIRVTGIFNSGGDMTISASKGVCLGQLMFATKEMEDVVRKKLNGDEFTITQIKRLEMSDVFTNLHAYAVASDDYVFQKTTLEDLMPVMVPNYDENEFKIYHAKQVLGWYIEVTLKYSALIDEKVDAGEVELVTKED